MGGTKMRSIFALTSHAVRALLLGLAILVAPDAAKAQPYDVPATWGGDFLTRPRLTGDWGGVRDDLGKKGVVLDVDLTTTPQVVMSGGRRTAANFWGNLDYTLNVDTQKLGLWPGGFLKISADTGFGSNVYDASGATVPVNTAALVPAPNDRTTALTNLTFTQFLSPKFGLAAGKIDTLDLGGTEFYGNFRTQFMNAAFNFPMTLEQVPLSAFGGAVIVLPREDIVLSAMALDPSGTPTSNDLGKAFSDGVLLMGNGQLTIKPFGLLGHQSVGVSWNNKQRFSLNQDPSNLATALAQEQFPRLADPGRALEAILGRFFPNLLVPAQPANRTSGSWAFTYALDQYFWQPEGDPKRGIGLFFAFGASDGNPNPIQYSYLAGIGGKGVMPGRPDDNFGIGFARTQYSSAFVPFLRQQLNLGLQHEDAIEMYYNAAITPWLSATGDLQIVNPALTKALNGTAQLANVDTAVVAGARLGVRF